ncbi:MAG TPA: hypothetical protein VIH54_16180, partial [Chthoniobacterales bacterium]
AHLYPLTERSEKDVPRGTSFSGILDENAEITSTNASFRPRQPHLARFSPAIDSMSGDQMLSCNAENKESSDQALDTPRSPVDGRRAQPNY